MTKIVITPELKIAVEKMSETMSFRDIERATGIERRRVKRVVEKPDGKPLKYRPQNMERDSLEKFLKTLFKNEAKTLPKNCLNVYQYSNWIV